MPPHQKTWKSRHLSARSHSLGKGAPFSIQKAALLRFPFFRFVGILIIAAGILGVVVVTAMFLWYARSLPSLEQIKAGSVVIPESTKIYDRTGEHLLYTIHGEENRTTIPFEEIPDSIKWATIATEDQDFYTRELAIDFKGIARALFSIIKNRSLRGGPGGSTITQQLVKNMILTREKTYERKIKEVILSFRIEKTFSRDEILALYLNQIPYGSNAYGIEQAAQTFFGKSAKDVTLAEAAVLSALPKATTYYSPFGTHTDELLARQKVVLKQMLNEGYVTEEQWKGAVEQEVVFTSRLSNIQAPHFVIYVRELLARRYGETDLEQSGLKVTTTLDFDMQQIAERIVKEAALRNDELGADNAGLVAIDPKSGEILTMVGSRDYFDVEHDGNFNVALGTRNPGSSFKPIVYATLFEKGYTPNTILYDVVTDFAPQPDKEYAPHDYNLKELGPVSIRKALGGSLNIPAVKALYLAGITTVLEKAAQLGYTTLDDPGKVGLSLALGGGGVKLLEHVSAFATLANDGVSHPPIAILSVENANGEILEEIEAGEGTRVFSANAARMVTDILLDNEARSFMFGSASVLYLKDIPSAVKTGTTNEYRDAWTMGYTPLLAAGVWAGNNDFSQMNKGEGGIKAAAPIWNAFMREALAKKDKPQFQKPTIPKTGKPILDGELEGVRKVKIDKVSKKLATEYTPQEYIEEQSFAEFHSILHYVKRSDPLGPAPENPADDPQYAGWEAAIAAWAAKSKEAQAFKKPPTEYDNVHVPANLPYIKIISPIQGEVITEDSVMISIETFATRGVKGVEYYLDGSFRESAGSAPFSRQVHFGSAPNGEHTLLVKITDDVGNESEARVAVQLNRKTGGTEQQKPPASTQPRVTFVSPSAGASLAKEKFPLTVRLSIENPQLLSRLDMYYNDKENNPVYIASIPVGVEREVSVEWREAPFLGTYPLYTIARDITGVSYRNEIEITIVQ